MKHLKLLLTGLMIASLMACGKPLVVSDGLVLATAPIEYLDEVPEPELSGPRTNSSLAEYINALRDALRQSNDDKAIFRWWWRENS